MGAVVLALATGCTGVQAPPPNTPDFDKPVPASEPRAELALTIDLEPSQACEEQFDLALYQDRRVDLIEWDAAKGACAERRVTIRYLSAKLSREQLIGLVRKLATEASIIKE